MFNIKQQYIGKYRIFTKNDLNQYMTKTKHKKYAKPFLHKEFEPKTRPSNYPCPKMDDLLFFIQRNYNTDAIIYKINYIHSGLIDLKEPISTFWYKFDKIGSTKELNYMQKKLAYGYTFSVINSDLIEFELVSYSKRFFLVKNIYGNWQVVTNINDTKSVFTHAYVYAEENGVFPDVKFIELFGNELCNAQPTYEMILI